MTSVVPQRNGIDLFKGIIGTRFGHQSSNLLTGSIIGTPIGALAAAGADIAAYHYAISKFSPAGVMGIDPEAFDSSSSNAIGGESLIPSV